MLVRWRGLDGLEIMPIFLILPVKLNNPNSLVQLKDAQTRISIVTALPQDGLNIFGKAKEMVGKTKSDLQGL